MTFFVRVICICCLLSILLIASQPIAAQQKLTLYTEEFPPYNYMLSNGNIGGINADISIEMCRQENINCTFDLNPWNRSYRKAKDNVNSGIVSTAKRAGREPFFHWIGPLVSGKACIFKLTSRDDIKIDNKSDLATYTIGRSKDMSYDQVLLNLGFTPDKNIILYPQIYGEVNALARGRVDFILGSSSVLSYQLAGKEISASDIQPVWLIEDNVIKGNFLALNKAIPSSLARRLQHRLNTLKKNGTVNRIKRKYLQQVSSDLLSTNPDLQACLNLPKMNINTN